MVLANPRIEPAFPPHHHGPEAHRAPLWLKHREPTPVEIMPHARLHAEDLRAGFGAHEVLHSVTLPLPDKRITAIIGPSGCGKSTFLRCLDRLHELTPGAWARGFVFLDNRNVYTPGSSAVRLRRHVGMVFQRANPFPTMSIRDNVLAGFRLNGLAPKKADEIVEKALRQAALWDEVKDVLDRSGLSLSGGQQQRLCIARSLALEPEVLLLDEPCSALDPIATAKVEELLRELRERLTVVIVTHNMQQAARVSDYTAFFYGGHIVEHGPTGQMFSRPSDPRTEDYIAGRFG